MRPATKRLNTVGARSFWRLSETRGLLAWPSGGKRMSFDMLKQIVWSAFALVAIGGLPAQVEARDGALELGLAKPEEQGSVGHKADMVRLGLTDAAGVFYNPLSENNGPYQFDWVRDQYIAAGYPVMMTLIIREGEPQFKSSSEFVGEKIVGNLQRIADGDYDDELREMAERSAKVGVPYGMLLFHEGNGDWLEHGAYALGNSPELQKQARARIIRIFKEAGAPAKFGWGLNRRSAGNLGLSDLTDLMPDSDVDFIGVSSYNRCGTNPIYTPPPRSFVEEFDPFYQAISQLTDAPIWITETATSEFCDVDQTAWYQQAIVDAESYDQVEGILFFFGFVPEGAASNTVDIEWMPQDQNAFRRVIDDYKKQSDQTDVDPAPLGEPVPTTGTAFSGLEYPYFAQAVGEWIPEGERNTGLNSATGNEFGDEEGRVRIIARQGIVARLNEETTCGPYLNLSLVGSPNQERYWDNNARVGMDFVRCDISNKFGFADYGGFFFSVGADYTKYFDESKTPDRLDGGEMRIVVRGGVQIGGNWVK